MGIKVKAKSAGYYGTRRRPGDVFEIASEKDRGMWMIEVDAPMPDEDYKLPFTSKVKGTKAGGNVFTGSKEAWEEPVGESKVVSDEPKEKAKTKKRASRRRK